METEDYLALFYPFDQLDVVKQGVESFRPEAMNRF